jgi:hypothetical protein
VTVAELARCRLLVRYQLFCRVFSELRVIMSGVAPCIEGNAMSSGPLKDKDSVHDTLPPLGEDPPDTLRVNLSEAASTVVMRPGPSVPRVAPPAGAGVEQEPGEEAPAPDQFSIFSDVDGYCPNCAAELSDPARVGWCLRCGYCRYLENVKPIEPLSVQIDPEVRASIELLLELAHLVKKKAKGQPGLHRYADSLDGLSRFLKMKARSGGDISSFRELLLGVSKKFKKGQKEVDLTNWESLFQLMSNKYRTEVEAPAHGRRINSGIPLLDLVPEWLAVLVCGLFIIAVGSIMAGLNLRVVPQWRLTWCNVEIGVGLVLLFTAQVSAFADIVPRGLRLRKCFMFLSPNLWWAVWQRLPATSLSVWLLGWGIALCISGVLILIAMAAGM